MTPNFLDSSLHMFFSSLIPILPIIHRPTFVYREASAPVLLNAIALGSLFLGTPDSIVKVCTAQLLRACLKLTMEYQGEALWQLAHIAIATSWPAMIVQKRPHDPCQGLQLVLAALLSQVYAALSRVSLTDDLSRGSD
jgi:hypothetical protein